MITRSVLISLPAILILVGSRSTVYAQSGSAFEVSLAAPRSVNLSTPSRTPQRIAFQAALVPDIMAFAYDLPPDRIERRPQWMYDNRYNVAVTTAAPTSLPEQKRLLQKLLEERFGLAAHRISYPSPVYYLVAGPKMNLIPVQDADAADVPQSRCSNQPAQPGRRACVFGPASMSDLALSLYRTMQLPVVDKTGIVGLYDFELGNGGRGGVEATTTLVKNSLGLNLELHRDGTAESLIIDRSEKPTQN